MSDTKTRTTEEQKKRLAVVSGVLESHIYRNLSNPETAEDRETKAILMESVAEMSAFIHAAPPAQSEPEEVEHKPSAHVGKKK